MTTDYKAFLAQVPQMKEQLLKEIAALEEQLKEKRELLAKFEALEGGTKKAGGRPKGSKNKSKSEGQG